MKLNTRARYALRLMVEMAKNKDADKPLTMNDISERQGISKRYLGQVVVPLKNSSLVKSIVGKDGGYKLAKKPENIKIGEIIQAAIGPIGIVDCVMEPESCIRSDYCECRPVYAQINKRITDTFNEFTLADLAGGKRKIELDEKTKST